MKEEMREVSIVKSIYSKATADARTLTGDLTIMLQITLVRYQNHWEEITIFHSSNLLVKSVDLLKTQSAGDAVY
jgi:uncharacterized membrane protein